VRANTAGWGNPAVDLGLVGGAVLGLAFVVWELRAPEPMLPMHLFRSRAFSAGNASSMLLSAAIYGTLFFVAQFLQTGQGNGPLASGPRLLVQAFGMVWIGRSVAPDVAFISLVVPFVIAGAGVSLAMPAAQNVVMSSVAPSHIGKAAGTYNMLRFLGGALGIAISASVFAAFGGFGSAQSVSAGFAAAIGVSAAFSLAGALAGVCIPPQRAFRSHP
jgi:hypothetical protein